MPTGSHDAHPRSTPLNGNPLSGRRGLLIDGHPTTSFRVGVAVQSAGAVATVVSDTHQALELIQRHEAVGEGFDFLILHLWGDAESPGLDTVHAVRAIGFARPVVALIDEAGGFGSVEDRDQACRAAGCRVVASSTASPADWLSELVAALAAPSPEPSGTGKDPDEETAAAPPPPLGGLMAAQLAPQNRLLQRFVEKLPGRLDGVQAAMRQADLLLLETLLQQIKRSADAHGYTPLGHSIRGIQACIRENERDLQEIQHAVDALMDLCQDAAFAREPGSGPDDDGPPSVA